MMAIAYIGYHAVAGMNPEQASNSENTIGSRRGSDNVGKSITCPEGGTCSQALYNADAGIQATSRFHDPLTGSAGVGFRDPSNVSLAKFVDIPVIGDAYNWGTMVPSWIITEGAYAAHVGISPIWTASQQPSY